MKYFGAFKIRPWFPFHLWGAGICVLVISIFSVLSQNKTEIFPEAVFTTQIPDGVFPVLAQTDPSLWTVEDWQKFGLSQREATQMLKYRDKVLRGNFQSMEELAAAYPLENRQELLNHLANFVKFPRIKEEKFIQKKSLKITQPIDPNTMEEVDWQALGLSERQASAIIRYRYSRGGSFSSVEEVGQSFVLRDYMPILKPWIRLSKVEKILPNFVKKTFPEIKESFDPNDLDLNGWMKLGLTERQATGVLNYKNKVARGTFSSVEQLKQCYMLQGPIWDHIAPWVRFSKVSVPLSYSTFRTAEEATPPPVSVDINVLNASHLKALGWNGAEVQSFLRYRQNLGNFASRTQLIEVPNVAREKLMYLKVNHELQPEKYVKINLLTASPETLETHPYIRKYARLILFHRVSTKNPMDILLKAGMSEIEIARLEPYLAQ